MNKILVTGATGLLGRSLTDLLVQGGYSVRVLSRRPVAANPWPGVEWVQGDLKTATGLNEALAGVATVIHAATNPYSDTRQVDFLGTRRLLDAAKQAGVGHFIYPSIVGIENMLLPYYRYKLRVEEEIARADLPWTILRATQFYSLLDRFLRPLARLPIMMLPSDFQFQPVAAGEVATRLLEAVAAGPGGRLPDFGGPQVRRFDDLARAWLAARGMSRPILPLRLPGRTAGGFRAGHNTCPEHRDGKITWEDWLTATYESPVAGADRHEDRSIA